MTQSNNITTTKVQQDSKLGMIPDGWHLKTLDEIGEIYTGGTPSTENNTFWDGDVVWYTPSEITKCGKFISNSNKKITQLGLGNSSAKLFPKNTIVVCTRATIGELAISKVQATTNQGFKNIFVNKQNDTEFVYYKLLSQKKQFIIKSCGSTFLELSTRDFRNFKIIIPPLPEQQKIAQILATWDVAINKQEALITQKQEQKKGLMQQLLTGKKRLSGFTDEWKEKKLGEIAIKKSSNLAANSISDMEGDYKVYGATGFLQKIDFYNEEEEYISIVKDGAGVGRVLLCEGKSSVLGTLDIIRAKNNTDLYFLYLILSRINFKKYIIGSTIPHIYFKDYKLEKILIPTLKEQQKIAEVLTAADNEITALQQQLQQLKTQKQGLMQQLLTGKIRVKN